MLSSHIGFICLCLAASHSVSAVEFQIIEPPHADTKLLSDAMHYSSQDVVQCLNEQSRGIKVAATNNRVVVNWKVYWLNPQEQLFRPALSCHETTDWPTEGGIFQHTPDPSPTGLMDFINFDNHHRLHNNASRTASWQFSDCTEMSACNIVSPAARVVVFGWATCLSDWLALSEPRAAEVRLYQHLSCLLIRVGADHRASIFSTGHHVAKLNKTATADISDLTVFLCYFISSKIILKVCLSRLSKFSHFIYPEGGGPQGKQIKSTRSK